MLSWSFWIFLSRCRPSFGCDTPAETKLLSTIQQLQICMIKYFNKHYDFYHWLKYTLVKLRDINLFAHLDSEVLWIRRWGLSRLQTRFFILIKGFPSLILNINCESQKCHKFFEKKKKLEISILLFAIYCSIFIGNFSVR